MISNQKDIQTGDVKFNHSMLIREATGLATTHQPEHPWQRCFCIFKLDLFK